MPGLLGLEPTPRNRGLLSLRAVNSLKKVFGANHPAWLTLLNASAFNVSLEIAVTMIGRFAGSCGSFFADTVTSGSVVVSGVCCAAAAAGPSTRTSNARDTPELTALFRIRKFSHIFWCCHETSTFDARVHSWDLSGSA